MEQWVWLVWDLLAVLVLVLCVYKGAKNGLLRSVLSAVSYLISAFLAKTMSPLLAGWGYNTLLRPPLEDMVSTAVEGALAEGASTTADLLREIPSWVRGYLEPYLASGGDSIAGWEGEAKTAVLQAVEGAVREPITWFLGALLFILLFAVFAFALRQLGRLLAGVNYMPFIGTANMIFGGVVGVVAAAAWIFVLAVVISLFVTLSGNQLWWMNHQVLENTYIIGIFYRMLNFL